MAQAPSNYASSLIQALRKPSDTGSASEVSLRANPTTPASLPINFAPKGAARTYLNNPAVLQMQPAATSETVTNSGGNFSFPELVDEMFSIIPDREAKVDLDAAGPADVIDSVYPDGNLKAYQQLNKGAPTVDGIPLDEEEDLLRQLAVQSFSNR